ncbi:exosortase N [Reichenbachiella versicolor]|uniref:exosortase N n=1 Tax=Reichenbachiella versicolor TaxID=1821036 RepID=UPI000D6E56A5|nr:exosortase N [Reichenbachiella versicolor]
MTSLNINTLKDYKLWLLAAAIPLIIFGIMYPHYLRDHTFFWICLVTLPLSAQPAYNKVNLNLYWIGLIIGAVSLLLPTTIGIYMIMCTLLILLLRSAMGNIQLTLIIHAFIASPFFSYFNSLVSFPLRLKLSQIVTFILENVGLEARIEGNMVYMEGTSFLVDEACAGLKMLGYGLLFGTIIIAQLSRHKKVTLPRLLGFYTVLLGLIVSGNIVRITLLILFKIMPEHWLHEVLGISIYAIQILIPFYFVVNWSLKKQEAVKESAVDFVRVFPTPKYFTLLSVFLVVILLQQTKRNHLPHEPIHIQGFVSKQVHGDVTKLTNDNALIYIKPPVAPYRADHNPMICWQGSGYSFKKIDKWNMNQTIINHAELIKGKDKIYTAWWFQSHQSMTGDQIEWRKQAIMNNEPFYLVNITCDSREELKRQIHILLDQNILS